MKKFFLLTLAVLLTGVVMAQSGNAGLDGSTSGNAIVFDWDKGVDHPGGTLWYRVPLAPLYEEDNPSLTLYLTNPSNEAGTSVDVSMKATVMGQTETKSYTIAARQYKTYTQNAAVLKRWNQQEILLALTSNGRIKLSAKVFEAADLDETCRDARVLKWNTPTVQNPSYSAWWKIDLKPVQNAYRKDAKVTLTNSGTKTVTLKVGQSLDCPSSGVTRRIYELAPGASVEDTIPQSMITSVQPDELYFGVENVESPITMLVETVDQPVIPIISATEPAVELHVTDTIVIPAGRTLYKISVADMDALSKYEPEFTYRNEGNDAAALAIKMAFERPAYGTSNTDYALAPGEEEIVVYKKNMLEGMEDGVDSIYLLVITDQPINFYGRFKHVREGKACKTNIDFNWVSGHIQEARTTQWYAVALDSAKAHVKDVIIYMQNQGDASATVKASMAFSCPYIDLQEATRTIGAGQTAHRRMPYSTYAMMSDTIWIGLETSQDIRFWADTVDAEMKAEPDPICLQADTFNWKDGILLPADTTMWYVINMEEVDTLASKFPTIFVQNLSSTAAAKITAELSLECPDEIENEKRSMTIAANGAYTKKLSSNLFENITADEVYLCVRSTQALKVQIRLNEEAEGSSCKSAVPFNWTSGNGQAKDVSFWYSVDLRDVLTNHQDVRFKIENKENAESEAVWQMSYACPDEEAPSVEKFTIDPRDTKFFLEQYASLKRLPLADSILYVNLQGTTSLYLTAEPITPEVFDTINREDVALDTLAVGENSVQNTDTAWKCITHEEVLEIREVLLRDGKTMEIQLANTGTEDVEVKVELAYQFPITETPQTITIVVPAGSETTYTFNWKKFSNTIKNEKEIFARVTIPATAVGTISYQLNLVDAFDGATRAEAIPIVMNKRYTQSPMTERWYKINTTDLKRDKNLYDKVLHVMTKNAGTGNADINIAAYEGLLSKEDLLTGFFTERTKTIKKGQGKSHNFPAQMVYALGDVEVYIWVRTTDSLVFESKFNGEYAPVTEIDTMQFHAKMVVPNVEYVLPADTTMWFFVCAPYIWNNYKYVDATEVVYSVEGDPTKPLTVEVLATCQDTMRYKMPVRKRSTKRKITSGRKTLRELLDRAIKHYAKDYGMPDLPETDIDSLLHHFITGGPNSDSITGYLRVRANKTIRLRLNTPQTTGILPDSCMTAPMEFDWEHGNVNPAGQKTWYHVKLDSIRVPKGFDLRLHVDNWGDDTTQVSAGVKFECDDPSTRKTYKIAADSSAFLDVDRDVLVGSDQEGLSEDGIGTGWPDLLIDYTSDKVTHIWAELIPENKRDTFYKTIDTFICYNEPFVDTLKAANSIEHVTEYKQWSDTMHIQDGVTMIDSITTFIVHPIIMPKALTSTEIIELNAKPLMVQGMKLFVDSSSVALTKYYKNWCDTVDSIANIDTVYWAKPVYDSENLVDLTQEAALDLEAFYPKGQTTDALLLVIASDAKCTDTVRYEISFSLDEYKTILDSSYVCTIPDVNPKETTGTIQVDTLGLTMDRQVDTLMLYKKLVAPELISKFDLTVRPVVTRGAAINDGTSTPWLINEFNEDKEDSVMAVSNIIWQVWAAGEWHAKDYTIPADADTVAIRYSILTECDNTIQSEDTIQYTWEQTLPAYEQDVPLTFCTGESVSFRDHEYTTVTTEDILVTDAVRDTIYHVTVTELEPSTATDQMTIAYGDEAEWNGFDLSTRTVGVHTIPYSTENSVGCDSTITLTLTVTKMTILPQQHDITICEGATEEWHGNTYSEAGTTQFTAEGAVRDTLYSVTVTVLAKTYSEDSYSDCKPYAWNGLNCNETKDYQVTLVNDNGCDSVATLHFTLLEVKLEPFVETGIVCNQYEWRGYKFIENGDYYDTLYYENGCDSVIYKLTLTTLSHPYQFDLPLVPKYGDRLLMINRYQINQVDGWYLDTISDMNLVKWYYRASQDVEAQYMDKTGFYLTKKDGSVLDPGFYHAEIDVPAKEGEDCGLMGKTIEYEVKGGRPAPALVPTLAQPGEDIHVLNLNPEQETRIRIYTTEGLIQGSYTVRGEESYTIKAAADHGFYIVELISDSDKSTLRYIVK